MIKGYFVNDGFNVGLFSKNGDDVFFSSGLRTYDTKGECVERASVVLESLKAPLSARNPGGYVPVYLGYDTGWILMHAETFDICGKAKVPRNWIPITNSWFLRSNRGDASIVNCETGLERKLGSSCSVIHKFDEHILLLSTVKLDQNHRINTKSRKLGAFDANNNKWLYSMKLKGPVKKASGQILLEKLESEILILQISDGKITGRISDVDETSIRVCFVVDLCIAVQTRKAIYTIDLSTREQKVVLFEGFGSKKHSVSLKLDGLVVFFQEEEVVRVYNLPLLEFEELKIPLSDICDDSNGYVVVDKVGEYLTFVRRVKSEFESNGRFLHVRYFYNPSESSRSGDEVEPIKAHCKKIEAEHGLRHYKLYFDNKTDFDTYYRQAVSYIEAISLEYGFAIGTDEPYDEMWTGQLIVDTSGQDFTEGNYSELKKLLTYMEWKLVDIAKPMVGKNPKIKLILK